MTYVLYDPLNSETEDTHFIFYNISKKNAHCLNFISGLVHQMLTIEDFCSFKMCVDCKREKQMDNASKIKTLMVTQ